VLPYLLAEFRPALLKALQQKAHGALPVMEFIQMPAALAKTCFTAMMHFLKLIFQEGQEAHTLMPVLG